MQNSQIQRAVNYLLENPDVEISPVEIKRRINLPLQESTLGRKLRMKAAQGILHKDYKRIPSGEMIAVYSAPEPPSGNNGDPLPAEEGPEPDENNHVPLVQGFLL